MMRSALLSFVVFLGVCLGSWAQDTASIVGTVKDSSGGVIAAARVTVSNPEKGFTRELVSNSVGEYSAQIIPIGNYVVTAQVPGFHTLVRSGITVGVGQVLRVDLTMAVGQATQEVTVSGSAAKVETETAAISGVITGTQIANLDLNGRNFVTLALLVPGAVPDDGLDTSHVGVLGNNNISFNGGRMEYNNWEIDGGNNTDEGSSGTFNTYPNLDTIAEFRISTSNYGAEMGKHAGATIEVATKSGTKDFHGDAFEYVRNDKFDANPWDINRASIGSVAPKSDLKWNDFGYTLGGPFYIPGHYNSDKSKTFFFWSEDWRRYREGQTVGAGVPSTLMRQGNFSECDPSSSNYNLVVASGCTIPTNPDTGNPYPGDTVPIDPNAGALLNGLVPLPNSGPIGYVVSSASATNWRQEQIRVDQNVGDKTQLFVRWTQDAWDTIAIPALWTSSNSDTIKTPFLGPGKSSVIHFTHTFKPSLMNEFVVSYSVDHILLYNEAGSSSPAQSIDKPSSWTVKNLFSANASNPLLPSISIGGGTPFGYTADAGNHPWFNSNPIVDFKENVAWMLGSHALKFGVFFQDYHKNEQFGANTQGFFSFSDGSPISTGNALADMYLGRIASYQEGTISMNGAAIGGYPKGHWAGHEAEPYLQDDWKVTNKLTLNLGLRYYYFQPFHDVSATNIDSAFVPSDYNPAAQAQLVNDPVLGPVLVPGTGYNYTVYGNGLYACGTHGVPKGCYFGSKNNFAPRFGFAYDPFGTGKTSIRGGYGIYYEMGNGNETNAEGGEGNPPVSLGPTAFNLVGYSSIQPIDSPSQEPISPGGFTAIPLHQKWPSVQQFSLGIQHEFPGSNIVSLSYVGSLGRHLATSRNLDQVPLGGGTVNVPSLANTVGCDAQGNCDVEASLIGPGGNPAVFFAPYRSFTGITGKQNTAVSSYNSLQFSWRHDVGHGLTFEAAYTWSHAIDDSTSTYFSTGVDDNFDLSRWKATSDLNRAQVVEMSYVYELPFFKHSSRAVTRQALGGWTFSGIASFYTGEPVDFGCGLTDPDSGLGYATGIGGGVRCNSLGPVNIKKGVYDDPTYGPTPTWIDPSVVGQVTLAQLRADGEPGMFGYMGRNPLTGPGVNNWDLALLKDFEAPWFKGEHSRLQFRWETFNTFNHTQYGGVNIGCSGLTPAGAPCTGPNNIGNGEIGYARSPRIMQLGMKFIF
ncbi:MAG TPA: carboxypeptidase-like regulatory domain-containing protein [Terriglobia bacterium]|nr:carboxypeptidase-like regulatory domain-containing protein [Terriglobia bacterium]